MARFYYADGLVHLRVPEEIEAEFPWISNLQTGIAVEGGSARSVARRVITGEYEPVRDIDLVCISASVNDDDLDALAAEYMPDDYSFGHGIQRVKISEYFASRDFTINEVLVADKEVLCTPAAFKAYKLGYIEPSANEVVKSRQRAKALYLCAALETALENEQEVDEIFWCEKEDDEIWPFDMALFLNKAMSRGRNVANAFCQNLYVAGYLAQETSPLELARNLSWDVNFEFRDNSWSLKRNARRTNCYRIHSTDSQVLRELENWYDEEEGADYTPVNAFTAEEWAYANGEG